MFPDASPTDRASSILKLLADHGESDYIGEPITQLAHSLQCAHLAAASGGDSETIIAALLHDVGQFLPPAEVRQIAGEIRHMSSAEETSVGRVGHEAIGANYLAHMGFSLKVAALVGAHVAAKRYLCAIDPKYHDTLSDASKKSLQFQGGPMKGEELEEWRAGPWVDEMCRLRKWDDAAKIHGLEVQGLESYQGMIEQHLKAQELLSEEQPLKAVEVVG